jgi:hypothetical protein
MRPMFVQDNDAVPLPHTPIPTESKLWKVNRELTFELVHKNGGTSVCQREVGPKPAWGTCAAAGSHQS